MSKKNVFTKICEDCNIVFQLFSPVIKTYCPKCGDNVRVYDYKAYRVLDKHMKPKYKEEEMDILHKVLKGKLRAYQAALMLGRSTNAVAKKVSRMRKQAGAE